ncbi:MAG: S-layer homology domain-containing protein [Anaerovoracaceae bacterium]
MRNGNRTLASSSAEPIQPNVTTALDVLESTLKAAGIDYKIERSGYVKEIDGIGEFSTGANTGWMYSVNGTTPPTTAAADYKLKDGDVVRWYYTEDYTKDPSSKGWSNQEPDALEPQATIADGTASATLSASDLSAAIQGNTGTTLTIEPTGTKGASAVEVNIPAASAASIASDTALDLSVVTPVGTVTIPNDTLGSIASQASGSITIRVESVDTSGLSAEQQQAVGQDPVYDISIFSGGTQISNFGGKAITISLPYELKEGEDASGVAVWYLNDAGELQRMRCTYDPATGMATFETTHLSKYLVGYSDAWYNPFEDVRTGDWFYNAVAFAANNQLFDGVSKTAFAPDQSMTRAMLATVLHRVEGSPAATAAADFGDVESGQWYSEAIAWATERGITKGYDSRTFGTNDSVTREQMAEILYRYAEYKKLDVSARADVSAFDDGTSVSSWAEQGVSWAVSTGLIQGVSATKLAPSALSTRAQVATVLMRWLGEK